MISAGNGKGNKCEIKVNGKKVAVKNGGARGRGMHLVVIEPNTGKVVKAKSYDTHGSRS